jgi:Na+/alanine symporter
MVISGWRHASVTLVYGASAAILSATVLLAVIFSGKFAVLAILSLVIPTLALVYFGIRKKD